MMMMMMMMMIDDSCSIYYVVKSTNVTVGGTSSVGVALQLIFDTGTSYTTLPSSTVESIGTIVSIIPNYITLSSIQWFPATDDLRSIDWSIIWLDDRIQHHHLHCH
jgi:hypothetical protein